MAVVMGFSKQEVVDFLKRRRSIIILLLSVLIGLAIIYGPPLKEKPENPYPTIADPSE